MIIAALVMIGLGLTLLWLAQRSRTRSGLPSGEVAYADAGGWHRSERPLYSSELGLTGKPDYVVHQGGVLVPVEVKSRPAPGSPYASHVLQLAAYCLLVERTYGRRPSHGIIKYADRSFTVDYVGELEQELLRTLTSMRQDLHTGSASRRHTDSHRCAACGHRNHCEQRLA